MCFHVFVFVSCFKISCFYSCFVFLNWRILNKQIKNCCTHRATFTTKSSKVKAGADCKNYRRIRIYTINLCMQNAPPFYHMISVWENIEYYQICNKEFIRWKIINVSKWISAEREMQWRMVGRKRSKSKIYVNFSIVCVCFVFRLFFVFVSCFALEFSCLYRYTRNTKHEARGFRVSYSKL